jgi:hypothetical protein
MSASNFHAVPKVPESVADLDPDVLIETLSRHGVNVSDAASELRVASADLRRLLWANPHLTDAAAEMETHVPQSSNDSNPRSHRLYRAIARISVLARSLRADLVVR